MKAVNRRNKIKELIDSTNKVQVSDLAESFNVSMETIRRDLDILSEEGTIEKIHGGAIKKVNSSTSEYYFKSRLNNNLEEKKLIAKIASQYIEDGDIIALDAGTTVLQLIDYIYDKNISIVTSSLPVLNALCKYDISHLRGQIIFLGGEFNENSLSIYGELSTAMLKNINISKAFISCDGFNVNSGIFNHNMREGLLTKEIIKNANTSYLLLESSKLHINSFYKTCSTSDVDIIISSEKEPDDFKKIAPNSKWIHT